MTFYKVFLFLSTMFILFSVQAQNVFEDAEVMPRFAGCDDIQLTPKQQTECSNRKLIEFIRSETNYPTSAKENKIEGKVIIDFVVDKTGKTTDVKIVNPVGGGCSEEAVRVVEAMPYWTPGLIAGAPVNVKLRLPFSFKIPKGNINNTKAQSDFKIYWGELNQREVYKDDLLKAVLVNSIYVRDLYGKSYEIDELKIRVGKPGKQKVYTSTGEIDEKMKKKLLKLKTGTPFTVEVTVQQETKFYKVKRSYQLVAD